MEDIHSVIRRKKERFKKLNDFDDSFSAIDNKNKKQKNIYTRKRYT